MRDVVTGWLRRRRLWWKLLVPFVLVVAAAGLAGTFLIVRDAANRAQDDLDEELFRRGVEIDAHLRDEALYLLESGRLAANIEGIPEAVTAGDAQTVRSLVASVLALRERLELVVITDESGFALVEVHRRGDEFVLARRQSWELPFVHTTLRSPTGAAESVQVTLVRQGPSTLLALSAPIGDGEAAGAAIVALDGQTLAQRARARAGGPVALFDPKGDMIGAVGGVPRRPPRSLGDRPVRVSGELRGQDVHTLYSPLELRGADVGAVAVSIQSDAAAGPRSTAARLVVVLLLALAAVALLGALLTRSILRQVRELVGANRALGRGNLATRAEVLSEDELGELARGLNAMAEQLQAGQEELELRVEARTDELQRITREMAETTKAWESAAAAMSHEFRNNLMVVMTNAEMLGDPSRKPRDVDWRIEVADRIKAAVMDLEVAANSVLETVRLEVRGTDLDLEDVDVTALIADFETMLVPLARRADLSLAIEVEDGLPAVRADRARLRQVVVNLVTNAIKYTPPGGRVGLSARRAGRAVEVGVADTGVGIEPEHHGHLFEPFYRVAGSAPHHGASSTGLGLSLAKRLVELQGGEIWFESEPGVGSKFFFTIPVAPSRGRRRSPNGDRRGSKLGGAGALNEESSNGPGRGGGRGRRAGDRPVAEPGGGAMRHGGRR